MSTPLPELIERYERLSSADVCDILNEMGYPNQALSAAVRPLAPDMVVAGPAFTIGGQERRPGLPKPKGPFYKQITPDCVVVMATNGHHVSGPWGENTGITAQMHGARGFITDGGTRDGKQLVELAFPTFCRFVTPVICAGRFDHTCVQEPVELDGQVQEKVTVAPGDFVIADFDGAVVVPADRIEAVLVDAEKLAEIEEQIRAALRRGEDRGQVYKRYPKFAHVTKKK
ncbi:MAG: RraA family protein [Kiritimatiellae bacterium]|nr:RraA family protein [Kiritimatiellia bacterium]